MKAEAHPVICTFFQCSSAVEQSAPDVKLHSNCIGAFVPTADNAGFCPVTFSSVMSYGTPLLLPAGVVVFCSATTAPLLANGTVLFSSRASAKRNTDRGCPQFAGELSIRKYPMGLVGGCGLLTGLRSAVNLSITALDATQ